MTADRPSVEDMLAQARLWPRDGFGEGLWFHAMADEIERAHADLDLLARSGCRVREYNGRRFVEIVSDVQP
jgi:hypothetical protein